MRLTKRDEGLLWWANGMGYVTVAQVSAFMATEFSTAARRVRILCGAGLLARRPMPMSTATVLIPTRDACALIGDDLPPIAGVRIATARHDLALVDCAHALQRKYRAAFEPERRLRQRGFAIGDHLPDGILNKDGAAAIAVELELSQKAPARLVEIFNRYAANLDIDTVWYIVMSDAVERHVRRLAEGRSYVKIGRWRPNGATSPSTVEE